MNLSLIRTVVVIPTNSSGVNRSYGDVVVLDAAQESFTTTTVSGFSNGIVGVIIEKNGIANGASGKVATCGYVPRINLSSAASFLDLVKTHTVAGQGVRHAAPRVEGDFAQVLDTGTNPPAILFGIPTPSQTTDVNDYILIVDEKAAGTDGGGFTSGAWQTRTLNTEVADDGGHASLASNQITLAAGTYRFHISAPALQVNNHQAKLRNITDSSDVAFGTSMYSGASDTAQNRSEVFGQFTIATSKTFEVQHRCGTTKATNGFGEKANFGAVEKYTIAEFWKVG